MWERIRFLLLPLPARATSICAHRPLAIRAGDPPVRSMQTLRALSTAHSHLRQVSRQQLNTLLPYGTMRKVAQLQHGTTMLTACLTSSLHLHRNEGINLHHLLSETSWHIAKTQVWAPFPVRSLIVPSRQNSVPPHEPTPLADLCIRLPPVERYERTREGRVRLICILMSTWWDRPAQQAYPVKPTEMRGMSSGQAAQAPVSTEVQLSLPRLMPRRLPAKSMGPVPGPCRSRISGSSW